MKCKRCNGTDIRSRRTYSHGTKSKPTTTLSCKKCGSTDIETQAYGGRKNYRRR